MNTADNYKEEDMGFLTRIKNDIKYVFQSSKGKYSLNTYVELLGEITDSVILEVINKDCDYIDGEVLFSSNTGKNDIIIVIEMRFKNRSNGKLIIKRAEQDVGKENFVDEAVKSIEKSGTLRFDILMPEEQ